NSLNPSRNYQSTAIVDVTNTDGHHAALGMIRRDYYIHTGLSGRKLGKWRLTVVTAVPRRGLLFRGAIPVERGPANKRQYNTGNPAHYKTIRTGFSVHLLS